MLVHLGTGFAYQRSAVQYNLHVADRLAQVVESSFQPDVDEYAIKYMVGHQITDITEKVYTRRDPSWLAEEIRKIQ